MSANLVEYRLKVKNISIFGGLVVKTNVLWKDNRYELVRDSQAGSLDDFYARVVAAKIPVEPIGLKPNQLVSIPASVIGKTIVNFAGKDPVVESGLDQFDNLQIRVPESCVLEVVFTSEKVRAVGRNRGPHPRKIVFTVK